MNTLELIKKYGLSIRQIPFEKKESFIINTYTEKLVTPEHSIHESVLRRDINKEKFIKLQRLGSFPMCRWENNCVFCKVAVKKTLSENGGYWLSKIPDNNKTIIWNIKTDYLAPTLEESVQKLVNDIETAATE